MPKRTDIKTILIIGSGPIVIGQGCEFDYSGTQACKALMEEGYKVILVDGDLGGADLHLFFDQIAPPKSLNDFLSREVDKLEDILLATPHENLKLICGGNEMVSLANIPFLTKEKLKRHIRKLDADFVLIDLGAGTSYNTLDLFSLSDEGIIVCTPEPHARVDAYGFIKNMVYRKLQRHFSKDKPIKGIIEKFAREAGRRTGRIQELVDLILAQDTRVGCEAGDLLDSELHDALMVRQEEDKNDNQIIEVFEKGYKYRDRVIRHAKVVVNKI